MSYSDAEAPVGAGRFAPSPSGDLHLGNLRTAVLAWLFARSSGRRFLVRVEDLDRVRPGAEQGQLADLAALGIDWDAEVVHQSRRRRLYDDAIDRLTRAGIVNLADRRGRWENRWPWPRKRRCTRGTGIRWRSSAIVSGSTTASH